MSRVKIDFVVKNVEYASVMCYNLLWRNKMERIELDNNYYMELIEDEKNKENQTQNIQSVNLRECIRKNCLLLYIDFNLLNRNEYKKILRKLLHIKKMVKLI